MLERRLNHQPAKMTIASRTTDTNTELAGGGMLNTHTITETTKAVRKTKALAGTTTDRKTITVTTRTGPGGGAEDDD